MKREEVIVLMKNSRSKYEWRDNCIKVLHAFSGEYPDFWHEEIIEAKIADGVPGLMTVKGIYTGMLFVKET